MKIRSLAASGLSVSILLANPAFAEPPRALTQLGAGSEPAAAAVAQSAQKLQDKLFAVKGTGNAATVEVRDEQLGKLFQVSAMVMQAEGEKTVYGEFSGEWVVYFEKSEGKLEIVQKNTNFRADPGSPEAKIIERSYSDAPLRQLEIQAPEEPKTETPAKADPKAKKKQPAAKAPAAAPAPQPKGSSVGLRDMFVGDAFKVAEAVAKATDAERAPSEDRVTDLRVFGGNMEVDVRYAFKGSAGDDVASRAGGRNFFAVVHYSMVRMPEGPDTEAREADPRVGYFVTRHQNLSRPDLKGQAEPTVALINRWHLEKEDPTAAVSKVKNPVTYWIDETVSEDIRPIIEKSILSWNAAFEAIGLRDAVRVRRVADLPAAERKTFNVADVTNDVVVGVFSSPQAYAIGPSRATPDGRIYHAAIFWSDRFVRILREDAGSESAQRTLASVKAWAAREDEPGHAHSGPEAASHHAEEIEQWATQAASWRSLLRASGRLSAQDERTYFEQAIQHFTMHETGHTLGLRHNFKGSRHAGEGGDFTASVMDYTAANPPVLDPKTGKLSSSGSFFQTDLGAYDRWAIRYGYVPLDGKTPEKKAKALARIAGESATHPELEYATDEDADRQDPDTKRWDGPGDPLTVAKARNALARQTIAALNADAADPASKAPYEQTRRYALAGVQTLVGDMMNTAGIIGGVHSSRQLSPAHGAAEAFAPVPRERQQAALDFVTSEYLAQNPFRMSPQLLRRMGQDRTGSLSDGSPTTAPYDQAQLTASVQTGLVTRLLDPSAQRRLEGAAQLADAAHPSLALPAVFDKVQAAVLTGVAKQNAGELVISADRQQLQTFYVGYLIGLRKNQASTLDGNRQAKRCLRETAAQIDDALRSPTIDATTRAHLEDLKEKIDRHFTRPVPTTNELSMVERLGFGIQAALS